MSKKSKKQPLPSAHKQLFKWLDSYEKASAAVEKHGDLLQLLEQGGGICKIEQFLPVFVAEGIHQLLEQFSEADWNVTAANDDYTHNNIAHEFLSTKSALLESVFRVFTLLLPDSLFTFSAAKYCRQGHIKPHDDRAYTQVAAGCWWRRLAAAAAARGLSQCAAPAQGQHPKDASWQHTVWRCGQQRQTPPLTLSLTVKTVPTLGLLRLSCSNRAFAARHFGVQVRMEDGSIQLCSRNIACIYYLTKDWTAADGGLLIDHEAPGGPRTHVPAFNR